MVPQSFGFPFEQGFAPNQNKQHTTEKLLDELAQNVTNGAKAGLIDPVIYR